MVQEQNSFPGKTNILLSKKVDLICTAYEGLEQFFPKQKIRLTGNPVRKNLSVDEISREEAHKLFDLSPNKKTILVLGGSLGARTLNQAMLNRVESAQPIKNQFIWQCGKYYFDELNKRVDTEKKSEVRLLSFISRMDAAYCAADVIISRAGALSVSELCLMGKPVILVPSPNVSEDHQTKNAMSLVRSDAALIVRDVDCDKDLIQKAESLLLDKELSGKLSINIKAMAKPNATSDIVNETEINTEMNKRIIDYKYFFFIGIGGIGMSALARYFNSFEKGIAGYDRNSSVITDALITEDCEISFEDSKNKIPNLI